MDAWIDASPELRAAFIEGIRYAAKESINFASRCQPDAKEGAVKVFERLTRVCDQLEDIEKKNAARRIRSAGSSTSR